MKIPWYFPLPLPPKTSNPNDPSISGPPSHRRPPLTPTPTARSARETPYTRRAQGDSSLLCQRRSGKIDHSRESRAGVRATGPSQRGTGYGYLWPEYTHLIGFERGAEAECWYVRPSYEVERREGKWLIRCN